jgi:ADP-ribose pyrophosphatase YjhB (NUDIX family)
MPTPLRQATVCFLRNKNQVLLALIEYGPNDRKWTGIGGFVEAGESLEDAVVREAEEETYIKPISKLRRAYQDNN